LDRALSTCAEALGHTVARLDDLPHEVAGGIAPEAVAAAINENLRQQFVHSTIPQTADAQSLGPDLVGGSVEERCRKSRWIVARSIEDAIRLCRMALDRSRPTLRDGIGYGEYPRVRSDPRKRTGPPRFTNRREWRIRISDSERSLSFDSVTAGWMPAIWKDSINATCGSAPTYKTPYSPSGASNRYARLRPK
jgi:hypothetical protein